MRKSNAQTVLLRSLILVLIFSLALLGPGCSSDSGGNGGGGGTPGLSDAEQLDSGVTGLADFGQGTLDDPNAAFFFSPQLQDLMAALFGDLVDGSLGVVATATDGHITQAARDARLLMAPERGLGKRALTDDFGTYARDENDLTEPYPGWVLIDGENPSDGIIFQFDGDDDIYLEDENGDPIPAEGEIRMIDVVVALVDDGDGGTLEIPTAFVFEVEAGAVGLPQVTFFRLDFDLTLDPKTELPTSISIGNPSANDPGDPGASFLGPLFFAASLSVEDTDWDIAAQLFDSGSQYVIAVGATILGWDLEGEDTCPESITLTFGFGETPNPDQPPYVFEVTLDQYDEETGVAQVTGDVRYNGSVLASLAGDTTNVPVEVDGTTQECPNVDVTFADDPENPTNICLALEQLFGLLDMTSTLTRLAASF